MRQETASASLDAKRRPVDSTAILVLLGTLYAAQGIPMGLAFIAFPAILRTLGYSPEAIGLLGMVALPWAVKFLWAPVVDRHGGRRLGHRRSWIIPAQALSAIAYFLVAATYDQARDGLWPIIASLLVINLIGATQDIATDGLAVETLHGRALVWANGLQIGAFSLGMMIGGSATVMLFDAVGWIGTFALLGSVVVLSLVITLLVREPLRAEGEQGSTAIRSQASLRALLRRPGAALMLSVAALFHFAHAMMGAMTGPFLIDAGMPLVDIGLLNGLSLTIIPVVGAGLGSVLASRYGAARTALVLGTLGVLALFLWVVPGRTMQITFTSAFAIICTIGLAAFGAYVAFFAVFMQWSSVKQAGTDFTVLQCSETIVGILAASFAGQIAGRFGFLTLFIVAPLIGLAAMGWIYPALARLSLLGSAQRQAEPVHGP